MIINTNLYKPMIFKFKDSHNLTYSKVRQSDGVQILVCLLYLKIIIIYEAVSVWEVI